MEKIRSVLLDQNNRRDSKPENTDPEKDLLKMIFILIIIFATCYFPYQAHYGGKGFVTSLRINLDIIDSLLIIILF